MTTEEVKAVTEEEATKEIEKEEHICYTEVFGNKRICVRCGKDHGDASFLDTFNIAIYDEDKWPFVNFRRKHPKLGGKIANLERRVANLERKVKKLEFTNLRLLNLLRPVIKQLLYDKAKRFIDLNIYDMIETFGDMDGSGMWSSLV